ncbi:hypothetical protein L1277_001428 [Okibacterium sp. HSC-33S16]|uniref:hypothetical protein n=1 Tax=Okibacterium sp. HSC-33S16 TaxID=2910965 RepID=UPI00209D39ED|nr:hypothetical protein [Okibacterium sp. HSC-33S16]MCP2031337.1 hypothetical protein [Okibacterium sp. HSC-33S16]
MSDSEKTQPYESRPNNDADATDVLFPHASSSSSNPVIPARAPGEERLRPRFGTIFWGVILLVFAAFMVTNAIVPFVLDPSTWIIAGLVAGGVVLVGAGIAAAMRKSD